MNYSINIIYEKGYYVAKLFHYFPWESKNEPIEEASFKQRNINEIYEEIELLGWNDKLKDND